jgi:hypothetical protein
VRCAGTGQHDDRVRGGRACSAPAAAAGVLKCVALVVW